MPTCADCGFFKPTTPTEGECHANAPSGVIPTNCWWPVRSNGEWCGHWIKGPYGGGTTVSVTTITSNG